MSLVNSASPSVSPWQYFMLAYVAMSGLAYINFMPGVVDALAGSLGFGKATAGQIVAINGYGGLLGMLLASFLVQRVNWADTLRRLLLALAIVELATVYIENVTLLLLWRALAGGIGGFCLALGFAVLAKLPNSDRAFGWLLLIQFVIGSLVIYVLPMLEGEWGGYAVFYLMTGISLISFIFLLLLSKTPLTVKQSSNVSQVKTPIFQAGKVLMAVFLYQLGASAIYAYVGQIGLGAGLAHQSVNTYIATTGMFGLFGALLPIMLGNKYGRIRCVFIGAALSITCAILLHSSVAVTAYLLAMVLLFFTWPATQAYLLAIAADLDRSGRLASIAAMISFLGLATGPLLGASLLNDNSFERLLTASAACFMLTLLFVVFLIKRQNYPQSARLT